MAEILLSPDELITSTKAAAQFSRVLDSLSDHRWFIQRRGKIEAVLTSLEEYKRLLALEELVDHMMLGRLIEERERTDSGHRISLDELVEKYDLGE